MKTICTSDIHGYFPKIEPCDLLIIAGDVSPIDHPNRLLHQHNQTAQLDWICGEFCEWIETLPAKDIVWIGGNHDFGTEVQSAHRRIDKEMPSHVHYLKDEVWVAPDGRTVYGSPWTPNLSTWAWYASPKAWNHIAEDIPGYTDILVLHSPPSGLMLDGGHPDWAAPEPMLKEITQRVQPDLCVFGHIHEGYGEIELRGTKFANVAYCDQFYNPVQPPKEYEL